MGTVKLSGLRLGGPRVVRYPSRMKTPRDPLNVGYRYPAELISYAVWLYFRFPPSRGRHAYFPPYNRVISIT